MPGNSQNLRLLKGLGLSFEESVYAIAFRLEDDIRSRGREAVFSELPCRADMAKKVQRILGSHEAYNYALYWALGYQIPAHWESPETEWCPLDKLARNAIEYITDSYRRYILADEEHPWVHQNETRVLDSAANNVPGARQVSEREISDLYVQAQQLMNEVRYYNEKRDQALARIESLLTEIKDLNGTSESSAVAAMIGAPQDIDIDMEGPISQIRWPYRSLCVLQELKLDAVTDVVGHFSDFDNFINGKDITLWEWMAVRSVLQREGLLITDGLRNTQLNETFDDFLDGLYSRNGINVRLHNCLRRSSIDTVGDLVNRFAMGAHDGWKSISNIRNLGSVGMQRLIKMMRAWTLTLPMELYDPVRQSSVEALDFTRGILRNLSFYKIITIEDLIIACECKNRFCGLRHVDDYTYKTAIEHLKKYGFYTDA